VEHEERETEDPERVLGAQFVISIEADGVDAAAHSPSRFALVHRHAGLAERAGEQAPVQQVTRAHPETPLGDDVEGESRSPNMVNHHRSASNIDGDEEDLCR